MGRPIKKAPNGFGSIVETWEKKQFPLSKVLADCGGISEAIFYRRLAEYRIAKGNHK
jgi:hypothetical protein